MYGSVSGLTLTSNSHFMFSSVSFRVKGPFGASKRGSLPAAREAISSRFSIYSKIHVCIMSKLDFVGCKIKTDEPRMNDQSANMLTVFLDFSIKSHSYV